jgi:hypothetical protein
VVVIDSPDLRALYEAPMALIRPDQIVAWRGDGTVNAGRIFDQVLGGRS